MRISTLLLTAMMILGGVYALRAQGQPRTIHIIYSDHYHYSDSPAGREEWLGGEVRLRHDSTFLFCDTAYLQGNRVDAVGNTSVVQGDSLRIFADTLIYDGSTGIAILIGRVVLENGGQQLLTDRLTYDSRARQATYEDGAWLRYGETRIYSQRGIYLVESQTAWFRDSVQVISPDFRLKADSLYYVVPEDRAYFTGPTRIRQGRADLYCESGYYALSEGYGWFEQNAQYADSVRQATADRIYYDSKREEIRLIGNAEYREGTREARGDTLDYRERSGDFLIRGNAFLQDGVQTIEADGIDYNTRTERFSTQGRAAIQDGAQTLRADEVFNAADSTDLVIVRGAVLWRDTSAGITLECDSAYYRRSTGYLEAMGDPPLLINEVDGDTLFLIADRIIASRAAVEGDSSRRIQAYPRVFVFKKDLQAICDSLAYSERDSLFSFYRDPVVWSEDTTQFTADTIVIRMAEQKLDSIYLIRRGLIINSPDGRHFNQIKGRIITGSFRNNAIHRMDVNGNAEAIYYALDEDDAFIGVNQSECSDMLLTFEDNQVRDIYYLRDPKSVMYPMAGVRHDELRLEGFRWRDSERPVSLDDMIRRWRAARYGPLLSEPEEEKEKGE